MCKGLFTLSYFYKRWRADVLTLFPDSCCSFDLMNPPLDSHSPFSHLWKAFFARTHTRIFPWTKFKKHNSDEDKCRTTVQKKKKPLKTFYWPELPNSCSFWSKLFFFFCYDSHLGLILCRFNMAAVLQRSRKKKGGRFCESQKAKCFGYLNTAASSCLQNRTNSGTYLSSLGKETRQVAAVTRDNCGVHVNRHKAEEKWGKIQCEHLHWLV